MKLYRYEHPSTFQDEAVYRYGNTLVEFYTAALCPDCTSPTVWVDELPDGTPYAAEVYHDKTCIQVKLGQGQVAPTREEALRRQRKEKLRKRIETVWPLEIDIANAKREDDA